MVTLDPDQVKLEQSEHIKDDPPLQAAEFCQELRTKTCKLKHLDINTNRCALETVLPGVLARLGFLYVFLCPFVFVC